MCILFAYNGSEDVESDYSLIIATNRDEYYDRPASTMAPWTEDASIIGGRDFQAHCNGGTWLAWSTRYNKSGILLNLPEIIRTKAKSRGRIISDYLKGDKSIENYISDTKEYFNEYNGFIFVTIEFRDKIAHLCSYNNSTNKLATYSDKYIGFGNSIPEKPLTKIGAGKLKMEDICSRLNQVDKKEELISELIEFLRSEERHLPDPQLEKRNRTHYEQLSSIFVRVPEGRYGTRTHTIILVTKTGLVDLIEVTMQPPIDPMIPQWFTTKLQFSM